MEFIGKEIIFQLQRFSKPDTILMEFKVQNKDDEINSKTIRKYFKLSELDAELDLAFSEVREKSKKHLAK